MEDTETTKATIKQGKGGCYVVSNAFDSVQISEKDVGEFFISDHVRKALHHRIDTMSDREALHQWMRVCPAE